jgi:hypothetical protein
MTNRGFTGGIKNGKNTGYYVGMAAEMFVAAQCFRRKWLTALSHKNAEKIDMFVTELSTGKIRSIDVKGTANGSWPITKKSVGKTSAKHFYVLVSYRGNFGNHMTNRADCFIIPSKEIKKLITKGGREGQEIKSTTIREKKEFRKYIENWNLIISGGKKPVKNKSTNKPTKRKCSKCGKTGHNATKCRSKKPCHCGICGDVGHNRRTCENN